MARKTKHRIPPNTKAKHRSAVSLAKYNGDHGTMTAAAMAGKTIEPIPDSPNAMARVRTIDQIGKMTFLSMKHDQAAREIRNAWGQVETLSSGGGGYEPRVDTTPRPDAAIDAQIDARSRLVRATRAIPKKCRYVIEAVCFYNQSLAQVDAAERQGHGRARTDLITALSAVADDLNY